MELRYKLRRRALTCIAIMFMIVFLAGCGQVEKLYSNSMKTAEIKTTEVSKVGGALADLGDLKVSFIDVGQADAILVQQGDAAMLIDAGNNGDGEKVKKYIERQKITELSYVVGTHAHEDHIGGMDYVINSFKIGKVYFPKQVANTETFKDFAKAVSGKGLKFTAPKVGETFKLGGATCQIIAPNSGNYEDSNDYSVVIKITYGKTSFLLTGDAEDVSEKEILQNGLNLRANVLKVGHHGSKSSTSPKLLDVVDPQFAVISVGKENKYGHPTESTLKRLQDKNITVYRTDISGTIVANSDGNNISFSEER